MSRTLIRIIVALSFLVSASALVHAEPPPGACTYDPSAERPRVEFWNCLNTTLEGHGVSSDQINALIDRLDADGNGVLSGDEQPQCNYDPSIDRPRIAYWNCLNASLGDVEADIEADPAPTDDDAAPADRAQERRPAQTGNEPSGGRR